MSTYIKIGMSVITASALLVGCGGSGNTPGNTAGTNNQSIENVVATSAEDENTVQNDDGVLSESENTTESVVTDGGSSTSEGGVTDEGDGIDMLDADSTVSSMTSSSTYPNSFCVEPGSTSVSFEAYEQLQLGVHAPFPASGFGWDGTKLCDLEGSQGLDEIEVLIPFVKDRPDTDGRFSLREWQSSAFAATLNYETSINDIDNLLLSNNPDYIDGTGNARWRAMHDGVNLYILIEPGSEPFASLIFDSDLAWNDDSIEIYIDGDNSKDESYDGVNDFVVLLSAENEDIPFFADNSASGLRVYHRAGPILANHVVEVSINLESAGIEIGKPFGFDVHINDDDNGGDRDAKWAWFEKTGLERSWMNPSVFGTLLLTDCEDRNQCGSFQTLSP